jgi:hypothetical protein
LTSSETTVQKKSFRLRFGNGFLLVVHSLTAGLIFCLIDISVFHLRPTLQPHPDSFQKTHV